MARKPSNTAETKPNAEPAEQDYDAPVTSENPIAAATPVSDYTTYSRSRCGGALRTAREKQGLSVHDVASKLKISGRQIESIEADQFDALPEATIVRGFIRNYAKLLKIEAEPLLDAYNVLVPTKEPLAFTVKPSTTMKVSSYKKPSTGRYIVAVLFVLLALGAWFFYQSYIQKPNPTLPSAEVDIIEPLPEAALPAAERVEQAVDLTLPAPATSDIAPPANAANPATADASTVPPVAAVTADTKLAEMKPVEAKPAETKLESGMAKLEFNANQETWISVVDASGKEVYNKIIFAGGHESFNAKLPINVVIGNAGGATMTMNNKSVNLGPHTRSNVARIQLDKLELNQFE